MRIASTSCVVEAASGCAAEIDLLLTDIAKPVDFPRIESRYAVIESQLGAARASENKCAECPGMIFLIKCFSKRTIGRG